MIIGLDHIVIAVRDIDAGVGAHEHLLGRAPAPIEAGSGVATSVIATDNVAVEIMAPAGEGEGADRVRAAIDQGGEGLKSLAFAVVDIERTHRRAARVGLEPEAIKEGAGQTVWRSFRANTKCTRGVRVFFVERAAPLAHSPTRGGAVSGLDHVVIRTSEPDHAAALYGARLGLDMRLDREVGGRRLMFFRVGDAIVEIAHDALRAKGEDLLWGLSWRVENADAARARLAEGGLNVSEVRAGLKPGTRVFTVRDGTCGAPTLMIEALPKRD